MNRSRPFFLSILALLGIISGSISMLRSFPIFTLYESVQQGGILEKQSFVTIHQVQPNTPAATAGLQSGDTIISVNEQPISETEEAVRITNDFKGRYVEITYGRDGEMQTASVFARTDHPEDEGRTGMVLGNYGLKKMPLPVLVPTVIIRAYAGFEENATFFGTSPYRDTSFSRLKSLLFGVLSVCVGVGLWKLKRWAYYTYLVLSVLNIATALPYVLNPANYAGTPSQPLFATTPSPMSPWFYLFGKLLEVFFISTVFRHKKLFR